MDDEIGTGRTGGIEPIKRVFTYLFSVNAFYSNTYIIYLSISEVFLMKRVRKNQHLKVTRLKIDVQIVILYLAAKKF